MTTALPAPSTPTGVCKKWCNSHSQPWSKKCTWSSTCDGCSACGVYVNCLLSLNSCEVFHLVLVTYFQKHVPTLCRVLVAVQTVDTTAAPAPLTVTGVCKKWCNSHSQPWSAKCTWSNSCGGCPECSGA